MSGSARTSLAPDPGLAALVMLLRFQGFGVDPEQIRHQFGATPIGVPEMLRCAKGFGLKARSLTTKWERLATYSIARNCRPARRELSAARQGGRRQDHRSGAEFTATHS